MTALRSLLRALLRRPSDARATVPVIASVITIAAALLAAGASGPQDTATAKAKSQRGNPGAAGTPAAPAEKPRGRIAPARKRAATTAKRRPARGSARTTGGGGSGVEGSSASKSTSGSPAGSGGGKRGSGGAKPTRRPSPDERSPSTSTWTTRDPAPVAKRTAAQSPPSQATSSPERSPTVAERRRTARARAPRPAGATPRPSARARSRAVLGVGGALAAAVDAAAPAGGIGSAATEAGGGERFDEPAFTRTVRDIVEVVPEEARLALAALLVLSGVLCGGYLLTALRARRLARQRADLLQEVGLLQSALLPPVPANVGAMRTSVAYRPSDGPGAGGDFYDALTIPDGRAAFLLGDVSGHGRQALARTAFIRYTLRAYLEAGLEPRLALQLADPVIGEHLGSDFATVVLAVHDPRRGSLTYACAGHPAPIVVGPTRPEPVLAASSPPIGLGMRTGVRQTSVPLPPGSIVCLYTDGLAEARTRDGILGRPRLTDILEELGRDATAPALLERVADEARLVTDDMATVVLSPTAGVTAGDFHEERLEVDLVEIRKGLAGQFLEACGIEPNAIGGAVEDAQGWAIQHGAAVLHVHFGVRGPTVEVLPRNVESLEAASRRRALA